MAEFDVTISARLEGRSTREVNDRIEWILDSSLPYSDPTVKRADWTTVPYEQSDDFAPKLLFAAAVVFLGAAGVVAIFEIAGLL